MKELENCELCEHRCRVNRLTGETGVCRMTTPLVASAQLHPAPPGSYSVFLTGCNYKCLNCQNWSISQYPDNAMSIRGYVEPAELAVNALPIFTPLLPGSWELTGYFFPVEKPPFFSLILKKEYIGKYANIRGIDPFLRVYDL